MSVETRVVRCKQCGAPATLEASAREQKCAHCGAALPKPRVENRRAFPNPTPLKPGMTAQWQGQEYTLTGRVVFRWSEEGETSYWHEFEMVSADGHCVYLEYEEGNWKLMEAFVPTNPVGPHQALGMKVGEPLNLDGSVCRVTEISQASVHSAEGELTYAPEVGQNIRYLDARSLKQFYAVEWTPESIEFYRGRPLAEREVLSLFGLHDKIRQLDARQRGRNARGIFAGVALACSLLAFLLGAAALSSGRVVSHSTVPLQSVPPDGMRFRVGQLNPAHHIHRLVIFGGMREASAWVAGILATEDGTELLGPQRDFWDESGHDSDGYWHESDLRAQSDFVVTRPGPYSVNLYVERDPSRGSYQNVGYELRSGVIYPSYYFIYGVVVLLISIPFFLSMSKKSTTMSG